jgi:hypothetical protein
VNDIRPLKPTIQFRNDGFIQRLRALAAAHHEHDRFRIRRALSEIGQRETRRRREFFKPLVIERRGLGNAQTLDGAIRKRRHDIELMDQTRNAVLCRRANDRHGRKSADRYDRIEATPEVIAKCKAKGVDPKAYLATRAGIRARNAGASQ